MKNAGDSEALTRGDITKFRALVAHIIHLSPDRPELKFAVLQQCCSMANPSASDVERVQRIGRYLVEKPRAECLLHWQQSGELEAYSDADRRGDKVTWQSVSAGVITRGGHFGKVWIKKHQVVSLSNAGSELYAAVKNRVRGIGNFKAW